MKIETPEERRKRWCKLRKHLCCKGLTNDIPNRGVPDGTLKPAESTTRLDVQLVGYYKDVLHESVGTITAREVLTLVLAAVAFLWLLGDLEERAIRVIDLEPLLTPVAEKAADWRKRVEWAWGVKGLMVLQILVIVVQFGLATLLGLWFLSRRLTCHRRPLCLSLEELSMSLPDGNLHSQWRDLYSVTDGKKCWPRIIFQWKRPWRILQRAYVCVELNNGLVATLYVPKDDCRPLADLMRTLIRRHRQLEAASTKPSRPVPRVFQGMKSGGGVSPKWARGSCGPMSL